MARARWATALSHAVAWAVFGLGYVGAVVFVAVGLRCHVGSVLLILAAGARLSSYVGATIGEIGFLRGIWLDGRGVWSGWRSTSQSSTANADASVPDRLTDGIRLDGVGFAYPAPTGLPWTTSPCTCPPARWSRWSERTAPASPPWSSCWPRCTSRRRGDPGRRPAAGPDAGPSLARQVSGAFQDFYRFEFTAQRSVGVGDLPQLDTSRRSPRRWREPGPATSSTVCRRAWTASSARAGRTGEELSFGQWQKLALSRGYMRDGPLLMILDEPTAALDAETEHELFERYADRGRGSVPAAASRSSSRTASAPSGWPT